MRRLAQGRWIEASTIARHAMGTEVISAARGSPRKTIWRADEDPLAWWCLTEWIYAYGQRIARSKRQEMSEITQ